MKLLTKLILLIAILWSSQAIAEELFQKESFAVHPKIGMSYNIHSSSFRSIEGSADCGLFESGSGSGITGGLFFEKKVSAMSFAGIGFGLVDRSATLTVTNNFPARDLSSGEVVNVQADNNLAATLSYLEIQPDFRYLLLDNLFNGPLRFVGALRIGIPISNSFDQKEEIVSPSGAVFVNAGGARTRTREIASGDITDINKMAYGLSIGFENMLKIGTNNYFTQQVLFDVNLNDVAQSTDWKAMGVRLELGLRYSFSEKEKIVEKPVPPPPPAPIEIVEEVAPPEPSYSIKPLEFVGKLNTGNELLATVPLVNAVFFEKNSAEIPSNYSSEAIGDKTFYSANAVEVHNLVLPRIAAIVENNSKASIILQSATSGSANEAEGIALSRNRANAVKNRLLALGIEESRIKTEALIAPKFTSNQDFPEGIAENQRVDIIVKNAPLQEYVDIQKYRELIGSQGIAVNYENYPANTKATLASDLGTNVIDVPKSGKYNIPAKKRIDENSSSEPYQLFFNIGNEKHSETGSIDLSKLSVEMIELNLENFEAILRFDYNSSILSDDNKGLLTQLSEKLPAGATIEILGSADALGTEERNKVLSTERAKNTEQFIKSVSGSKFTIETGINNNKFDEKTAQGRFLNRSIRIKVRNAKK